MTSLKIAPHCKAIAQTETATFRLPLRLVLEQVS